VTAAADGVVRLWRSDGSASPRVLRASAADGSGASAAAVSPDGKVVVTAGGPVARFWDAASGRALGSYTDPDCLWSAAFDAASRRAVLASSSCFASDERAPGSAQIVDVASGRLVRTLRGHADRVGDAAFSPDGTLVVTASDDGTARIWSAADGRWVRTLAGHTDAVVSAAFSPDGRLVVTASADGTARVFDVASGRSLHTLIGHAGDVASAAFSPDGKLVVTAGDDGTARIWDVGTGRQLQILGGGAGALARASFSPDGRLVLTAGEDGTARIWTTCSVCGLSLARLRALARPRLAATG
jgi:WD40 repeat protein